MDTTAIDFGKFHLTKMDLSGIHPDICAAFAITSHACNEANVLMKLYLDSQHPVLDNDDIDMLTFIHKGVIQRTWSAKLFEFSEFIKFQRDNRTTSAELMDIGREFSDDFDKLSNTPGYRVAKYLRHEATNHYILSAARKNLEHTAELSEISMFVHENVGNSFYLMGEVVMILGRLNRQNKSEGIEKLVDIYNSWSEWNEKATILVTQAHSEIFRKLVLPKLPKQPNRVSHNIPYSMIGHGDCPTSPIFMRMKKPDQ